MTSDSDIRNAVHAAAQRAKQASRKLATTSRDERNAALQAMAGELERAWKTILAANGQDLASEYAQGLKPALRDRLTLTESRFQSMVEGVREAALLPDPLGAELESTTRPNGLVIKKIRVPIGVIGVIYESRPNVTADAAALCIKSGNAVILRGGSEARQTNQAIARALQAGLSMAGLPEDAICFLAIPEREAVHALVQCQEYVDLVIPRGGEGLVRAVTELARVPVLKHAKGVCHIYVEASADQTQALDICDNAKTQRPGVCNAVETVLVDVGISDEFLPKLANRLSGVELRGDPPTCAIVPTAKPATAEDWSTEYLDLILTVGIVCGTEEAIEHINEFGSGHTEAILSQDPSAIAQFCAGIDSGVLMVNASTRFNDGSQFGKGAEIGISTDKLHARGPVGVEELTTYKYVVLGSGQVRP